MQNMCHLMNSRSIITGLYKVNVVTFSLVNIAFLDQLAQDDDIINSYVFLFSIKNDYWTLSKLVEYFCMQQSGISWIMCISFDLVFDMSHIVCSLSRL